MIVIAQGTYRAVVQLYCAALMLWHSQVVSDAATTRAPPAMTAPRNPGPPSAVLASSPPALLQPAAGNSDGAVPEHSATIPPACAPDTDAPHAATAHAGQTGSDASAPSTLNPKGSSSTAVASSGAWASVADSSVGTAAASTVLGSSSLSTVSRRGGSQTGALSAMLKARSDVAVLRDIKLGPLLGAGSYGRVFRGKRCLKHDTCGVRHPSGRTVAAALTTSDHFGGLFKSAVRPLQFGCK